ncbi:MICOS complex subunit mic60 [Recurvomyces mirabilis]|uniref:MICOS complex subunit MIC60 n=1 Tax=Recurvomyces mirabilis TaxID=574656 RepID=A0AAE0WMZ3_9PEZI|nr:MICOS complex subunit mic60 [Recurvomyces mirabilis]KAK5157693.1 MICOS complex subunit mic60 [Recurvomyces mirabilis]
MLRAGIARSARCAEQSLVRCRGQWQPQRAWQLRRTFADGPGNQTVLPGSESKIVAGVPQAPILNANKTNLDAAAGASVKVPPPPPTTSVNPTGVPPTPSTNTGNLPPTGHGTAATGPTSAAPPPPPKRPRRRFRNFLYSLILLSALGYAGGVYYSLISDNFHDFFTEYIPFGEDAVSYFEEREFRKRFPSKDVTSPKNWPSTRGENKVTIGKSSGLSPRSVDEAQDLGGRRRHVSAVEDDGKPQPGKAQQNPDVASQREKTQAVEAAKKGTPASDAPAKKSEPVTTPTAQPKDTPTRTAAPAPPTVTTAGPAVDHINIPQAVEPVVQDLVKMVNNVITAVNASPEASKFTTVVQTMKDDLNKAISEVGTLKETAVEDANKRIKDANTEFDSAAKELVRRLETEMREQESKWREEYEVEREKLSTSYQHRLDAELDAIKKVQEEKNQNSLLQQEIALQKQYMDTVKSKVEEERSGRLSKLDALSTSVSELESLTSQWNEIVDSTLRTQHLQVAVEAVKAKVLDSDRPTPFLNELVALKEVSKDSDLVGAAIASIHPQAYQSGLPSPASLIDRFRRVAAEVRKAALLPADAGVASHAASAVLSRLMFSKKSERGLPEGGDVEATLARTEVLLEEGDLDAAAREMNGLQGWAGVLSRDWVGECRLVLEVRQAVEVMATEARLQSLLVE